MLTEEQKRERKKRYYQDCLEYIATYREGDVFYHVTRKEDAPSLLAHGFDPGRIGTGGGCQGGAGFCCAWCEYDAWDWGRKLYGWGNEHWLKVLRVELPGVKLASHEQADGLSREAVQWAIEHGYILQDGEDGFISSPKLEAMPGMRQEFASHGWTVIGLYLQSLGYDGYWIGIEEIVIVNFDLLKPEAFCLATKGDK